MTNMTSGLRSGSRTNLVDLGPRERAYRNGGLHIGARLQTDAGIVLHHGAAARVECVLDALRETGLLDGREGAKADRAAVGRSRYEQGQWLRRLFLRAGLNPVRAMDASSKTGAVMAGHSGVPEISDEAARARMKYNRIVRELGPFADDVTGFICFDKLRRGEQHLRMLRRGLDRLCVLRS